MIKYRASDEGNASSREALEIIQTILTICGSMQFGKNTWQAILIEEPVSIKGRELKTVGVRIERRKEATPEPKSSFGKLVNDFKKSMEPIIIVSPLFEKAKVHWLNVDLIVGERRFSGPGDSLKTLPFRKDLNMIFGILAENLPELKYRLK